MPYSETLWHTERGTDLCSTLRRNWGECRDDGPARVIAQAIELGLGTDKANEILEALKERLERS